MPGDRHDIRLGDVVISMPEGEYGGVVQYELGRHPENGFKRKGFLCSPSLDSRSPVRIIKLNHLGEDTKISALVSARIQKFKPLNIYARLSCDSDVLFKADYAYVRGQFTCAKKLSRLHQSWGRAGVAPPSIGSGV